MTCSQANIQILIFFCHLKPVTAWIETAPKTEVLVHYPKVLHYSLCAKMPAVSVGRL